MSRPIIADVAVRFIKIAARFASHEHERAYICGVHICPHPRKGAVIVATDGHRMFVIHDAKGRCKSPITLQRGPAAALAKKQDKTTAVMQTRWKIVGKGGRVALQGYVALPLVDEGFPDWKHVVRVVHKARGASACVINPKLISDFAAAARELQHGLISMRVVPGATPSDPLMIYFPEAPHAFGVLMPMKDDGTSALPVFMKQMLDTKARK